MTKITVPTNSKPKVPMPPPPPPPLPFKSEVMRAKTPTGPGPIEQMVKNASRQKASDIHIRVGELPRFRIRGEMVIAEDQPQVTPELFEEYLNEILTPIQRQEFAKTKELDTAVFYPGFLRCRVNCFETITGGAMVLRLISLRIPSVDELRLPAVFKKIIGIKQGLILVTGPTGSGKSTTMAAMIRHLNETENKHIITIEDPIEFVHPSQKCLISQREVGLHTQDFHASLRSALREDPDVILIGEMRDRVTINIALQAAQTGHLVLGTLHTRSAINAINRLLNIFTPEEQVAMRIQIVESLAAVIAQLLIPATDGGRVAVHDILVNTPSMQDYLLKGDETSAFQLMQMDTHEGMHVMNNAIYEQWQLGTITEEAATKASPDPSGFDRLVRTGGYEAHRSPRSFEGKYQAKY